MATARNVYCAFITPITGLMLHVHVLAFKGGSFMRSLIQCGFMSYTTGCFIFEFFLCCPTLILGLGKRQQAFVPLVHLFVFRLSVCSFPLPLSMGPLAAVCQFSHTLDLSIIFLQTDFRNQIVSKVFII